MVKKNGKFSIAPLPFILQNLSSNKREYPIAKRAYFRKEKEYANKGEEKL